MRSYYVAWWNVENLFDEEDAVALGRRTDKVFRTIKNDIAGWTPELRDRKIDQLASIIAQMNNGMDRICSVCARWRTGSSSIGLSLR
jgi:thymidylate synthase